MNTEHNTKLRIILTGATGMVGEGVLHECLLSDVVETVLVVNRRPCGVKHQKLKEIIHADFFDLSSIASQLAGYNTCLFCLGVSSVGMNESSYFRATHTLTMHFASTVLNQNKGMTFCYISGTGTDSSEKGKLMWARVKGKTENDLMKLGFNKVFNFRPGIIEPTPGLKNTLGFYKYLGWLIPIIRILFPRHICKLSVIGKAMIHVSAKGYDKQVMEVTDICSAALK